MNILALDLGKFNSVSCLYDTKTHSTEFWTCATNRPYLRTMLEKYQPDLVVFESCSISGWVHDLCSECGLRTLVADPNQEAWKWKNVKRKTDRDDALKLARLAALQQLAPVHIPAQPTREHRWLVKYRKTLVGRVTRIQNNIRALFVQHGFKMPAGARAWTVAGLEQIAAQGRPLEDCSIDQLWRGQLDMELAELDAPAQSAPAGRPQARRPGRPGRADRTLDDSAGRWAQDGRSDRHPPRPAHAFQERPPSIQLRGPRAAALAERPDRPQRPSHQARLAAVALCAGRVRLGHAPLQRVGPLAVCENLPGTEEPPQEGHRGHRPQAAGALLGHAQGQPAMATGCG